jgi:hypothetical protein
VRNASGIAAASLTVRFGGYFIARFSEMTQSEEVK